MSDDKKEEGKTQPKMTDMPEKVIKKRPNKKERQPKERLHVYIPTKTIDDIDTKAGENNVNRSVMIQMLLNYGLKNFKLG